MDPILARSFNSSDGHQILYVPDEDAFLMKVTDELSEHLFALAPIEFKFTGDDGCYFDLDAFKEPAINLNDKERQFIHCHLQELKELLYKEFIEN